MNIGTHIESSTLNVGKLYSFRTVDCCPHC